MPNPKPIRRWLLAGIATALLAGACFAVAFTHDLGKPEVWRVTSGGNTLTTIGRPQFESDGLLWGETARGSFTVFVRDGVEVERVRETSP